MSALADSLSLAICSRIFPLELMAKINVPYVNVVEDMHERVQLIGILPQKGEHGTDSPEGYATGDIDKNSNSCLDIPAIADLVVRAWDRIPLEYEFTLLDAPSFMIDAEFLLIHKRRGLSDRGISIRSEYLDLDLRSTTDDRSANFWLKSYPLFDGAVGSLSPAMLQTLVRFPTVLTCRPAPRIKIIRDNEEV